MAPATGPLRPETSERGLASWDPADVADLLTAAWDGFLSLAEVAAGVGLDTPTRLPGWDVRDLLVHLGRWDDEPDLLAVLQEQARAGHVAPLDDVDARNFARVAAHRDATAAELREALHAARDRVLRFLERPDAAQVGRGWVSVPMGQLPLTGVVASQAYEVAVHALDLADACSAPVPDGVLGAGVGALVDLGGCLVARSGVGGTFAVVTPQGAWAAGSLPGSSHVAVDPGETGPAWSTVRVDVDLPPSALGWPAVVGDATDVLEAVSGRALAAQLLATRRLRVRHVGAMLRLAPAMSASPALPSGSGVQASLQALGQAGRLLGRVASTIGTGVTGAVRRR